MANRVVLTGLGIVSPLGLGVRKNWGKLLEKQSGIGSTKILGDEFEKLPSKVAGFVDSSLMEDDLKKVDTMFFPLINYPP